MITKPIALLLALFVAMPTFADTPAVPANDDASGAQTFEQQVAQRQQQLREQHEQKQQTVQAEQAKQAAPDPTANMPAWQKALTPAATNNTTADNKAPEEKNDGAAVTTAPATTAPADAAKPSNAAPATATPAAGGVDAAPPPPAPAPKVSPGTGYVPMMPADPNNKKGSSKVQYY